MNTIIVMSILGLFLLFIFFLFLMLRRTTQEFKRGMEGE
jgi:preprotein translocase subunit YajC